jgi:hypothetical protein
MEQNSMAAIRKAGIFGSGLACGLSAGLQKTYWGRYLQAGAELTDLLANRPFLAGVYCRLREAGTKKMLNIFRQKLIL